MAELGSAVGAVLGRAVRRADLQGRCSSRMRPRRTVTARPRRIMMKHEPTPELAMAARRAEGFAAMVIDSSCLARRPCIDSSTRRIDNDASMPSIPSALARVGGLRSWLAHSWAALRRRVRHRVKPTRATRPGRPEPTTRQFTQMHAALRQVLDHHPSVRGVLPALAAVERVLPAGPRALERLPVRCLCDASARLDRLAGDWSSDGLRQLREHLRGLCESGAAKARVEPAGPQTPARLH